MADVRPVRLSLRTARRLSISKQHLAGDLPKSPGSADIMDAMENIRYLQLDPTNAVAPSHLLVLWSRKGRFSESDLDRLMWKEKKLFEYWGHLASIVLTKDYPLYLARMRSFYEGDNVWDKRLRAWMAENRGLKKRVVDEIRTRGPLSSGDFEAESASRWKEARDRWGLRPSAWSSGSDVSRMLQFLFHDGTLSVAGRQGRRKVWDLSERWLPRWTPKEELSEDEVEYQGAQLSLKALGVGTPKQVAWHFLHRRYRNIRRTFERLSEDGVIQPVDFEGEAPKGRWYIHADDVRVAEAISTDDWAPRTTLLSPFDNLIADRDRTESLFGFHFRLEIYTPKEKRKHGFFVLPVLDGDRLIGRIDPVMDRQNETLVVNSVYAEHAAPKGSAPARRIADAVDDLARFLEAEEVVYRGRIPDPWKGPLR